MSPRVVSRPHPSARRGAPHSPHHGGALTAAIALAVAALGVGCGDDAERQAARLTGGDPARGRWAIQKHGCGSCHHIAGVAGAEARVGPRLDDIAQHTYLAGQLLNTPENMIRWIIHPQQVRPGSAMPEMGIDEAEGRDIAAYLYTLR